jgi:hypothetical protein
MLKGNQMSGKLVRTVITRSQTPCLACKASTMTAALHMEQSLTYVPGCPSPTCCSPTPPCPLPEPALLTKLAQYFGIGTRNSTEARHCADTGVYNALPCAATPRHLASCSKSPSPQKPKAMDNLTCSATAVLVTFLPDEGRTPHNVLTKAAAIPTATTSIRGHAQKFGR